MQIEHRSLSPYIHTRQIEDISLESYIEYKIYILNDFDALDAFKTDFSE